eukprot:gene11039-14823_t
METDSNPKYGNSVDAEDITKTSIKLNKNEPPVRKVICRYGPGCTHIMDPSHKEKFWHSSLPKLNDEQLSEHFVCNECGYSSPSLADLQLHIKRKTAWSNSSLIGCRISCLVDFKEWHEGFVTQYHKSGKHFVEFRMVNEKRWLLMKKIAFYIVERPPVSVNDESEFKDDLDRDGLAPIEDSWVFVENISLDYTYAQSVLFKIYGNVIQETGHLTKGHVCLTEADRINAQYSKGSLLYGELLPRGANKAFNSKRLDAANASVLFDMGMGTGKITVQAFIQFKNLKYVYGVELSYGRYRIAEEAVLKMVDLMGAENFVIHQNQGKNIIVVELCRENGSGQNCIAVDKLLGLVNIDKINQGERILHLECGNMFDVQDFDKADVVMMETDFPVELHSDLNKLLNRMRDNSRILTYLDLRRIGLGQLPFKQLESNRHLSDRYPTSWSVQRGHHFYLWIKLPSDSASWSNSVNIGLVLGGVGIGNMNNTTELDGNNGTRVQPVLLHSNESSNGNFESSDLKDDELSSRCFPFGFRFKKNEKRKKVAGKAKNATDFEDRSNERTIIPVNNDGSRSSESGFVISDQINARSTVSENSANVLSYESSRLATSDESLRLQTKEKNYVRAQRKTNSSIHHQDTEPCNFDTSVDIAQTSPIISVSKTTSRRSPSPRPFPTNSSEYLHTSNSIDNMDYCRDMQIDASCTPISFAFGSPSPYNGLFDGTGVNGNNENELERDNYSSRREIIQSDSNTMLNFSTPAFPNQKKTKAADNNEIFSRPNNSNVSSNSVKGKHFVIDDITGALFEIENENRDAIVKNNVKNTPIAPQNCNVTLNTKIGSSRNDANLRTNLTDCDISPRSKAFDDTQRNVTNQIIENSVVKKPERNQQVGLFSM